MRAVAATLVVVIAVIVLGGGAFVYSGQYDVGADQPHWPMTTWLLDTARDRSIRAHAATLTEPAGLNDAAKVLVGSAHYIEHCAGCHGAPGAGRDDLGKQLYPRPPDLADAARRYTPAELFWIVKHGIKMTGMPAWGDHSDDELWATVAFIIKLPGMTAQDYAKFVAASRAQGGDRRAGQGSSRGVAPPNQDRPAAPHDHPPGHRH